MKRSGNLYQKVYDMDNLIQADIIARKGKMSQYGIKVHDLDRDANLKSLQRTLINKEYQTSDYTTFPIYEPKERLIYRLPFRKSIKQNYCRMLKRRKNPRSIASYNGWLKHCNARNLERKTLPEKYLQSA